MVRLTFNHFIGLKKRVNGMGMSSAVSKGPLTSFSGHGSCKWQDTLI